MVLLAEPLVLIQCDKQGDLAVGLCTNATMHTPIDVTREALAKATELGADVCVGLLALYRL